MKTILHLAVKDLRVLFSDKSNLFWVFGFPALFSLFFGAVFSGIGESPSGMRIAVTDEDQSEFSRSYLAQLETYESLRIEPMDRATALDGVRRGKCSAAITLKPGFGDVFTMFDNSQSTIDIAQDPSRGMEGQYLQGLLMRARFEVLAGRFTDRGWMKDHLRTCREEVSRDEDLNPILAASLRTFIDTGERLLEDVNDIQFNGDLMNFSATEVTRASDGPVTSFQVTFPQAVIWGILGCSATFAISIVQERSRGTFDRLRVGPISGFSILGGKALACFFTCLCVVGFLLLLARLIFKMPIRHLPSLLTAAVCVNLCFVGLMMFISTLGRTEQSAAGAGWAFIMVIAMLGGGMVPLLFMPPWLRPLSHISPVKWSIYAMEGGIWRDLSWGELVPSLTVLLAIGTGGFLLGLILLRRQDQ